MSADNLRTWARDRRWQESFVYGFELHAHRPKDARRLAHWLFGAEYRDFCDQLKPGEPLDEPPEAPRAELLARILTNPHSGLHPAEREIIFDALWHYLDQAERRFEAQSGTSPKVLSQLLRSREWSAKFSQRLLASAPKSLNLAEADASDWKFLAAMTDLEVLNLSSTSIQDLSPLAGLVKLSELDLRSTAVSDLSPLAGLVELSKLGLSQTAVSDLSPLAGLVELSELGLSLTAVSDLSPLAGLVELSELGLTQTAVSDLSPLAGLVKLSRLYLNETAVSDLSPLIGLPELSTLVLSGVKAQVPEALRLQKDLRIYE
ncbi:MAG: leucine-rich repeat domain-containing protein [Methylococcales bacterium]